MVETIEYPSYKEYQEAFEIFDKYTTTVMYEFAKKATTKKDILIGNFLARGVVSLNAIMHLWELDNYHDCWVLYRCLCDRLFHLEALGKDESFELFEKWSIKQQYDARNRVRSDNTIRDKIDINFYIDTEEIKEKYKKIVDENIVWSRPKAEAIAKRLEMDFLYKYGYDYASKCVHPMADDGAEDFKNKLKLQDKEKYIDKIVLSNSFIITGMLIQSGLNYSGFKWQPVVYDFLDNIIKFSETGLDKCANNLVDVVKYFINEKLSEQI